MGQSNPCLASNKPTIYAAFAGLGKTYFCQHNAGWVDWDESIFSACKSYAVFDAAIENYTMWGYHLLCTAQPITLTGLTKFIKLVDIVVFMPLPHIKDVILARVAARHDDKWLKMLTDQWDIRWQMIHEHTERFKFVYLDEHTYISDVLNEDGTFTPLGIELYYKYNPTN